MTPRLWEDHLNYGGCDAVTAEIARANRDRAALLAQVRNELRSESLTMRSVYVPEIPWTADRIRQLRLDLGYTQPEMARLVMVAPHTWSRWERGANKPIPKYIRRMIQLDRGEVTP